MKKIVTCGLIGLVSCFVGTSWAGEDLQTAIGVTSKRQTLKTYLDAEGKQKGNPVDVASVTFPLTLYEKSSAGLVRARIADKAMWLDPDQLVIDATVNVKCLVNSKMSSPTLGVTRGANEGCK